jgi:hypothetical protein
MHFARVKHDDITCLGFHFTYYTPGPLRARCDHANAELVM